MAWEVKKRVTWMPKRTTWVQTNDIEPAFFRRVQTSNQVIGIKLSRSALTFVRKKTDDNDDEDKEEQGEEDEDNKKVCHMEFFHLVYCCTWNSIESSSSE